MADPTPSYDSATASFEREKLTTALSDVLRFCGDGAARATISIRLTVPLSSILEPHPRTRRLQDIMANRAAERDAERDATANR